MARDPNEFLMGGRKLPTVKFDNVGDKIVGIVKNREVQQQRDYRDNTKLLFWDDGNPREHLVVTLATDLRDATFKDDDGTRRVYLKAKSLKAASDAVAKAEAPGIEIGGQFTLTLIGFEEPDPNSRIKLDPTKLWGAEYVSKAQLATQSAAPAATPDVPVVDEAASKAKAALDALTPEQKKLLGLA